MDADRARRELVHLLQCAYSGELAAAIAYHGHAASVRDPAERAEIARIEEDEWVHRRRVGEILAGLGGTPQSWRERKQRLVGQAISLLCHLGGWFIPMYGAGRIERRNIVEYEDAARLASLAGRPDLVDDFLHMAEVEWDHERYFRERAAGHWMQRLFPRWMPPPPRAEIRAAFRAFETRALTGAEARALPAGE